MAHGLSAYCPESDALCAARASAIGAPHSSGSMPEGVVPAPSRVRPCFHGGRDGGVDITRTNSRTSRGTSGPLLQGAAVGPAFSDRNGRTTRSLSCTSASASKTRERLLPRVHDASSGRNPPSYRSCAARLPRASRAPSDVLRGQAKSERAPASRLASIPLELPCSSYAARRVRSSSRDEPSSPNEPPGFLTRCARCLLHRVQVLFHTGNTWGCSAIPPSSTLAPKSLRFTWSPVSPEGATGWAALPRPCFFHFSKSRE